MNVKPIIKTMKFITNQGWPEIGELVRTAAFVLLRFRGLSSFMLGL